MNISFTNILQLTNNNVFKIQMTYYMHVIIDAQNIFSVSCNCHTIYLT